MKGSINMWYLKVESFCNDWRKADTIYLNEKELTQLYEKDFQ